MQHGFQGKYQGMYTNFVSIGKSFSYELLPNFFYCWNKITKKNILTSSTNRKHNIPIVGGYNWIDFYIKKVAKSESIKTKKKSSYLLCNLGQARIIKLFQVLSKNI